MNTLSNWGSVAVIVGGYLLGFYFQNRRIDDLRDTMNNRFSDLKDFIKGETSRLEDRIDRLEHPWPSRRAAPLTSRWLLLNLVPFQRLGAVLGGLSGH